MLEPAGPVPLDVAKRIEDTTTFSSIEIPAGWTVEPPKSADAVVRVWALAPDGAGAVGVYSMHADGNVDLDLLVGKGPEILPFLGPELSRDFTRSWFLTTTAAYVHYGRGPEGMWSLVRYSADHMYAFLVVGITPSEDARAVQQVIASFQSSVPASADLGRALLNSLGALVLPLGALFGTAMGYMTRGFRPWWVVIPVFSTLAAALAWWIVGTWPASAIAAGALFGLMGLGRAGLFLGPDAD